MWIRVVDPAKRQARDSLIASIQQMRASVEPLQGEIDGLISAVDAAVGGAPSGMDARMTGDCQQARRSVAQALEQLSSAESQARALDITTMQWVDDPQ